ncbi:MAG: glycosyltransferase, partial [Lachnospiraceae bacterium]|nr:glycosyltransferase [Lachnospiraceae bacterium]
MEKVSVIVPVYNVEAYLRECLESIINQTYEELEIICIDDCSTDGSFAVLKEYEQKDSRIVILENE